MNDSLENNAFSPKGKIVLALAIIILIAGVALAAMNFNLIPGLDKFVNNKSGNSVESFEPEGSYESQDFANNENSKETDVDIDLDNISNRKVISIDIEQVGRADPFMPSSDSIIREGYSNSYNGYSLMAPPENLYSQSDAAKVVSTKVTGILYDSVSPSAILNLEGSDYLVKSGDYINNYKVLSISKDLVTVQLGSNVYKAGVGQPIDGSTGITKDTPIIENETNVYNLEHRFGGARK